jgi:hypothetical protein
VQEVGNHLDAATILTLGEGNPTIAIAASIDEQLPEKDRRD